MVDMEIVDDQVSRSLSVGAVHDQPKRMPERAR